MLTGRFALQGFRRVYVHPYRACVFLPEMDGKGFVCVSYSLGIFSRLPHGHKVIRYSLSADRRIFFELFVQQTNCLRALHRRHWVFPDHHFAVIDESNILKHADQLTPKIGDADHSITLFGFREIHAMETDESSIHHHPEQVLQEESEVLIELRVRPAVPHVPLASRIGVETCKWRRKYRIVDASSWDVTH